MERAHQLDNIDMIRTAVHESIEQERLQYAPDPGQEQSEDDLSPQEISDALQRNEDGDAWLYVEQHRDRFCYDTAAGRWYIWEGQCWVGDTLNEAIRAVDSVIEAYGQEVSRQAWQRLQAEKSGNTERSKQHKNKEDELLKRIRSLQTISRKEKILTLARSGADSLAIRGDEWDQDTWLLGCRNGVIDLRTGILQPGKPEDFIKTVAPVEYQGIDTPAPTWERFISDICGENRDLPAYLQKLHGYGITGLSNWHVYPIFYGPQGRNGKGTLLETIKYVLGDLAHKTKAETLLQAKHVPSRGSADADTLAFRGKRIIWASETSEGRKLNAARIKELCGGDTLNARAVYGRDPVEFSPTHLLILLTNEKPQAPAHDAALWERIHLIPFNVRFVDNPHGPNEHRADHDLPDKLKAEAPGILAWLVRGCLAWQKEGLRPPETVVAATAQYKKDEDLIDRFISDCCMLGPNFVVQAGSLYTAYQKWAADMGMKAMTGINFGKEMQSRFDSYEKRHVFYLGVGLRAD